MATPYDPTNASQAKIWNDPEYQRLWGERNKAISALGPSGQSFLSPERRKVTEQYGKPVADRFKALGGNNDDWYFSIGADGNPVVTKPTSTLGALGKAGLYTGLAAGAAFGAPALAGALGAGGGAAAGGATAANFGAGGIAGATGAAGAGAGGIGGALAGMGGVKGILGAVGPIAGAISGARGEGRYQEGMYDLARGRGESERALTNSRIADTRLSQALRLALLGGVHDAQLTPPPEVARFMPQMTGGIKPSAIKGREDIIAAMQPRILEALMSGNHVPELPDAPDSNWLDKILEGTSYGSAFLGALPKRTPAPTPGINVAATNPNIVSNLGTSFGTPKPRRGLVF